MSFLNDLDSILPKTTFGFLLLTSMLILTYFQVKRKNLKDTVEELQDLVSTMKEQQDVDRQRHVDDKEHYQDQIAGLEKLVTDLKHEVKELEIRAVSAEKEVEMLREYTAQPALEKVLENQNLQQKKTEDFHNSMLEVLQKIQQQSTPE